MNDEKIAKLKDILSDCSDQIDKEYEHLSKLTPTADSLPKAVVGLIRIDEILHRIYECGISGAKSKRVASDDIEQLKDELDRTSIELRSSLADDDGKRVTFHLSQFLLLKERIVRKVNDILAPSLLHEFSGKEANTHYGKNVFIVHGRDHEPMKELKAMLYEFGLNPIVLHEQPSGSKTVVEKLEKCSDVGYAFVILTPDDTGGLASEVDPEYEDILELLDIVEGEEVDINKIHPPPKELMTRLIERLKHRSRQNVVLEFGYFMGLLSRDRVCCLHKGDVELPSDMHGIVYIPFENSVEEIRIKIMKELKEAGYEVKI